MDSKLEYARLSDGEDQTSDEHDFLHEGSESSLSQHDIQGCLHALLAYPNRWLVIANLGLFCLSLLLVAVSAALYHQTGGLRGRNGLLKATSQPSPVLNVVNIPLSTKQMNGSLMETEPGIIYRQDPSPEVDAAWERIQTRDPIPISRQDVVRLGKDPSNAAKFPESFGYGSEAYIGKIDVFHQIHCLNTLRKNLRNNFPYYYGEEFPGDTPTDAYHNLHIAHCLNTLLENLKCTGNVDIYTHFWMDAQVHAFPDFNMHHKCRDFDAILAWQEENAVPVEKFGEVKAPEGYKVHVMSHEFKEMAHWYDDHPDDHLQGGEVA